MNPTVPLLYNYRRCPYAMRARMALLLAGRAFQTIEISLRDKPAQLLALSPKGTVPVLHLPSGRVIEESWQIMEWALADEQHDRPQDDPQHEPQPAWWRRAQSPANLALLQCNDGIFKQHLDRYKYPQRYAAEDATPEASRDLAVAALLHPLQHRLQAQAFLGGATACATDLAIFPFVRQFAAVNPAWFAQLPLPALQAWLAHWLESDLFARCMRKPVAPAAVNKVAPVAARAHTTAHTTEPVPSADD